MKATILLRKIVTQGDPNQSFPFQIAITLKLCISDPTLVKPKCVWEVAVFLKNCKQTAVKCKQILKIEKNLSPLKHILALPTCC